MFECILFENNMTYAMVCIGTFFPLLCLKVIDKDSMLYKSRHKPFEKLVKAFVNRFFQLQFPTIQLKKCNLSKKLQRNDIKAAWHLRNR